MAKLHDCHLTTLLSIGCSWHTKWLFSKYHPFPQLGDFQWPQREEAELENIDGKSQAPPPIKLRIKKHSNNNWEAASSVSSFNSDEEDEETDEEPGELVISFCLMPKYSTTETAIRLLNPSIAGNENTPTLRTVTNISGPHLLWPRRTAFLVMKNLSAPQISPQRKTFNL